MRIKFYNSINAKRILRKFPLNISPYAVAVGSPAKVIKSFYEETIEKLLEIKWGDFTEEEILKIIFRVVFQMQAICC